MLPVFEFEKLCGSVDLCTCGYPVHPCSGADGPVATTDVAASIPTTAHVALLRRAISGGCSALQKRSSRVACCCCGRSGGVPWVQRQKQPLHRFNLADFVEYPSVPRSSLALALALALLLLCSLWCSSSSSRVKRGSAGQFGEFGVGKTWPPECRTRAIPRHPAVRRARWLKDHGEIQERPVMLSSCTSCGDEKTFGKGFIVVKNLKNQVHKYHRICTTVSRSAPVQAGR